jgi:hypothetical protein
MAQRHTAPHGRSIGTVALVAVVAVLLAANWQAMNMEVDTGPLAIPRGPAGAPSAPAAVPTGERSIGAEASSGETCPADLQPDARLSCQPPTRTTPAPQLQSLDVRLLGVAATPALGKRALVRGQGDRQGTWMAIGEKVDGWMLREIGPDKAVFENGARRQELLLEAP